MAILQHCLYDRESRFSSWCNISRLPLNFSNITRLMFVIWFVDDCEWLFWSINSYGVLIFPGMEGVDKEKVQRVVYEMSKGSKYFEHEEKKEAYMKQRIESMQAHLAKLTDLDISNHQKVWISPKCWKRQRKSIDYYVWWFLLLLVMSRKVLVLTAESVRSSVRRLGWLVTLWVWNRLVNEVWGLRRRQEKMEFAKVDPVFSPTEHPHF